MVYSGLLISEATLTYHQTPELRFAMFRPGRWQEHFGKAGLTGGAVCFTMSDFSGPILADAIKRYQETNVLSGIKTWIVIENITSFHRKITLQMVDFQVFHVTVYQQKKKKNNPFGYWQVLEQVLAGRHVGKARFGASSDSGLNNGNHQGPLFLTTAFWLMNDSQKWLLSPFTFLMKI